MLLDALAATGKTRPRVCLVLTASGDPADYYAISYEAFNAAGCDVTQFKVFPQPRPIPSNVSRAATSSGSVVVRSPTS